MTSNKLKAEATHFSTFSRCFYKLQGKEAYVLIEHSWIPTTLSQYELQQMLDTEELKAVSNEEGETK